jgi:hypothetical protein
MPGSARQIKSNHSYEDGILTPFGVAEAVGGEIPPTTLILRVEDDDEHYANRPAPGPMHPATESFIRELGGEERGES